MQCHLIHRDERQTIWTAAYVLAARHHECEVKCKGNKIEEQKNVAQNTNFYTHYIHIIFQKIRKQFLFSFRQKALKEHCLHSTMANEHMHIARAHKRTHIHTQSDREWAKECNNTNIIHDAMSLYCIYTFIYYRLQNTKDQKALYLLAFLTLVGSWNVYRHVGY